jgi:hypothetical protein
MVGIEPTLSCDNGFLRPARLPIPPHPRRSDIETRRNYKSPPQAGSSQRDLRASEREQFGVRRPVAAFDLQSDVYIVILQSLTQKRRQVTALQVAALHW